MLTSRLDEPCVSSERKSWNHQTCECGHTKIYCVPSLSRHIVSAKINWTCIRLLFVKFIQNRLRLHFHFIGSEFGKSILAVLFSIAIIIYSKKLNKSRTLLELCFITNFITTFRHEGGEAPLKLVPRLIRCVRIFLRRGCVNLQWWVNMLNAKIVCLHSIFALYFSFAEMKGKKRPSK